MRAHLTSTLHAHYASASSLTAALSSIQGSEAEGDGMQRMSADVDAFCTQAITTFEAIFKPSVEAILISTKLAMLMGPSQLGACAGFFGLAGSWVRMVGPSFATLAANVQAADGALLAHRARVHAHTEEIDMLRGAATERALMDDSATLAQSMASRLQLQRFASDVLDTYVLRYVGILAALTAMLPALASSAAGVDDPTEYFLTCLHLLVQVGLALKDLVLSFKGLAIAKGLAARVHGLLHALEAAGARGDGAAAAAGAARASAGALLEVSGAAIRTPSGADVFAQLKMRVMQGERLLVRGPNGAGKSSIVRVLSGVWTPTNGSGTIGWAMPPERRLTLPQRPYVLPQMSLKQNLLYPDLEGSAAATATNAELLEVLRRVGLERLTQGSEERLTAPGGCEGLSPGECQRLCLGRLLVRRPEIAILDEPCASMEEAFEETFFRSAASAGVSLVAIAHHAKLERFHTHVLELDGRGEAVLKRM